MNLKFNLKNILLLSLAVILVTLVIFSFLAEKNYPINAPTVTKNINDAKPKLTKEDIQVGTGQELLAGQQGVFNYVGTLEDGTEFDASTKSGGPFTARIGSGEVIAGWDQGLPGMKVGGKRKLFIPYNLAYGEKANGKIPAKANLRFEVELLKINP